MRQPPDAPRLARRGFLAAGAGLAASALVPGTARGASAPLTRVIPASGEAIPVIGMGTWITFNVGDDEALRAQRAQVLARLFARGGTVVDSSPMYGSSEEVIGDCLRRIDGPKPLFSATKVWTPLFADGPAQMAESRRLWGVDRFDLMQVHNLVDWKEHLRTLRADKERGRIRYLGVPTSHGRRHDELERILRDEPLDFVQLTYNILDREAEARLLPLAADRGVAVLANRPFRRKQLFHRFEHHPLPGFAADIGCANWAQLFLKFIVSHPAVTCAIPATSRVDHMEENMGALHGPLPDTAMRRRMVEHVERL